MLFVIIIVIILCREVLAKLPKHIPQTITVSDALLHIDNIISVQLNL